MSNTVTPNGSESGVVHESQNNQVICTFGSHNGHLINADDALTAYGENSESHIIHKDDTSIYTTIDEVNYLNDACVDCSFGTYSGQRIPKILSIRLHSGKYIHKCNEELVCHTAYSRKKFVMDELRHEYLVLLCEGEDEEDNVYEYTSNCTRVMTERGSFWQHDSYLDDYVYSSENGTYYRDDEAAECRGLVYDGNEDEWIWEQTFRERYNEDGFSDHHNTDSYHSCQRRSRKDENHCGFSIGFEVEKEDREVKVQVSHVDLYDDLGWCKETDGSLDTKSGFEAVSPVYSLFGKQLEIDLKNCDLQRVINAEYNSESCGGHINISSDTFTKEELYEGISAFFPLLYCIYENRIHQTYCKAKKKNVMGSQTDKYSAVYIRDNRIEIRIFPAVKNIDNLIWRRDLIRIMIKNINATELQVFKMMMNKKSKLYRHLNRVMTAEKIHQKCVKFLEYSKAFNDKNIDGHGNNLLKK
jgi:hypothetical protein